jgi:hypothetical protein
MTIAKFVGEVGVDIVLVGLVVWLERVESESRKL